MYIYKTRIKSHRIHLIIQFRSITTATHVQRATRRVTAGRCFHALLRKNKKKTDKLIHAVDHEQRHLRAPK